MNNPHHGHNPNPSTEEIKKYLLEKQGKGPLFAFLLVSAIIFLVFLVSVLKPHKLYKKFIGYLFGASITINKSKYKFKHLLLILTGFYATLYFFLLMLGNQNVSMPNERYAQKMANLDKKWRNESQSWLAFLIVICLLSIYRHSQLFSSEKKLEETKKEYDENKTKKNE